MLLHCKFCIRKACKAPVHTGNKVEFNTVEFVETRLLPKPATKSTVADTVDFVASVYGAKATWSTFNKVDRVEFNFVASVYGAKATWSTFNKVDRVEFNLVASVFRA